MCCALQNLVHVVCGVGWSSWGRECSLINNGQVSVSTLFPLQSKTSNKLRRRGRLSLCVCLRIYVVDFRVRVWAFFFTLFLVYFLKLEVTILDFGVEVVCEGMSPCLCSNCIANKVGTPNWQWVACSKESGFLAHCPEQHTNGQCSVRGGKPLVDLLVCTSVCWLSNITVLSNHY